MGDSKIILVRHAESIKNVEDRHGGPGSSLSSVGVEQCCAVARQIRALVSTNASLYLVGHAVIQVSETLRYLGSPLGVEPAYDERMRGIGLGVLAGLTRAQAAQLFPADAERLELWRAGRIKIDQLRIRDAEPVDEFARRIREVLQGWVAMAGIRTIVAVCSRSTLIMVRNIVELGANFNYRNYKVYDFGAGSMTVLDTADSRLEFLKSSGS